MLLEITRPSAAGNKTKGLLYTFLQPTTQSPPKRAGQRHSRRYTPCLAYQAKRPSPETGRGREEEFVGRISTFQLLRQNLYGVPYPDARALLVEAAPDLQDTAGAIHGDDGGVGFLDVPQLLLQDRARNLW